jgi:hypothetical protein
MFDSQNPMTALGLMYALRLTKDQPSTRRASRPTVSWFTRLAQAIGSMFASRPAPQQPARVVKLPAPVKPDLPSKRAA